jgi:hypothetical protein
MVTAACSLARAQSHQARHNGTPVSLAIRRLGWAAPVAAAAASTTTQIEELAVGTDKLNHIALFAHNIVDFCFGDRKLGSMQGNYRSHIYWLKISQE